MVELIKIASGQSEPRSHAIFFHGLGGDLYGTWRTGDDPRTFWPRWLGEDIESLAVYLLGYEASISRWRGAAMHLPDRATNLLARLLAEPELKQGKLILIGHSLGGLVIKQLLRTADSEARHRADAANLIARVEKVVFLGTPHAGSDLATLADRLRTLVRPSAATACLVRNDPHLRDLNLWYRNWANAKSISHLTLTETKPIRIFGMIVKPDSSDPGFVGSSPVPIDADHRTICKPADRTSEIYVTLRAFIEQTIYPVTSEDENVSLEKATADAYGLAREVARNLADMAERQEKEFGSHKAPLTYFTIYFDQVAKIPIYGNMRYSSSIENVNLEGFDVVMDGSKLIAREIYGNKRWENMFVKRADLNRVLDRIRKHEIERGTA